jgi:MFS family permease
MGMQKDLGMKNNDFTWGATGFFLAYTIAELPQGKSQCTGYTRVYSYNATGALIQRFPVAKVLGGNIFCWAIVLCCTSAVKTSHQMIAMRTLLGFFESIITPALIMITSAWYQRNEAAPRFGLWYCGMGVGQILGGLISFAAQNVHTSFQGWRIMFLVIGLLNSLVAGVIFFWLPGTPEEAAFLSSAEKEAIAQRLHDDHAGLGIKKLRLRSVLETFLDLQTWLLCLLTILNVIPSGVITTYSSILIKGFGYTNKQAALLNMPSGVVTIIALLSSTYAVRKGYQRWFAIILMVIPTLIGACLMSFLPKTHKGGLLAGIYLVNFVRITIS